MFLTIDGPNGVGKSTFIEKLKKMLEAENQVFVTKEPSESKFGNYVRNNEDILEGNAYAYLIAADRCYHLEKMVEPELKKGKIVISDRYIESSLVLQAYDGVRVEDIWRLNCKFRIPDISIILLADECKLKKRLEERNKLTYFERTMTRTEEIDGYREATEFLKNKRFNHIIMYNNTEQQLESNLNEITKIILDLEGKSYNG